MFPRNRIDLIYRIFCLLAYLFVITFINSTITIFIIALAFHILTLLEKRFENIFLYILTIICFVLCLTMDNYLLLRIVLLIDYIHYYLNVDTLGDDFEIDETIDVEEREQNYIRFEENKKERVKDNNELCTMFVLVHIGLLLVAIVVG